MNASEIQRDLSNVVPACTREEFIEFCKEVQMEFIDPASQRENHRVLVSYQDLLKEIPGGADILWEERSVVSQTFECCGKVMHEEWGDDEAPLDALLRLYKRARRRLSLMATIDPMRIQ